MLQQLMLKLRISIKKEVCCRCVVLPVSSGSGGSQRQEPYHTNGNAKTVEEELRSEERLLEVSEVSVGVSKERLLEVRSLRRDCLWL